jgi:hypothetical protein
MFATPSISLLGEDGDPKDPGQQMLPMHFAETMANRALVLLDSCDELEVVAEGLDYSEVSSQVRRYTAALPRAKKKEKEA